MRKVHQLLLSLVVLSCTLSAQPTHTFTGAVDTAWVRHYGSGLCPSDDYAKAIAVDRLGNVYIAGNSGGDYATAKYNSSGETLWIRRFSGTEKYCAGAYALAVDAAGNVYVTGDFSTIKYNSSGTLLWVKPFGGISIAVDGSGNIYVVGKNQSLNSEAQYKTIKLNSAGDIIWTRMFDESGYSGSQITSLAVDGNENIYVTGSGKGTGSSLDYITLKYNPAGDIIWNRQYNGPGDRDDIATCLVVERNGDVFVTGKSSDSAYALSYATIKYNSSGDIVWVKRYDSIPHGWENSYSVLLTVDRSGNSFVTGYLFYDNGTAPSDGEYLTIKYNVLGDTLWTRRYPSGLGIPTALAVNAQDELHVAGTYDWPGFGGINGSSVIKYGSAGDTLWIQKGHPFSSGQKITNPFIVLDSSGNLYTTGGSITDYLTTKISSVGDTVWQTKYDGPKTHADRASSLAVDGQGNVYVTGQGSISDKGYGDYVYYDYAATIKYNSSGDTRWIGRFNALWNSGGSSSLAVDAGGNVCVTGTIDGSYATIKYNSSGDTVWVRKYNNGPLSNKSGARSLAVDAGGNVYVTGWSDGSGTNRDIATIKYTSSGDTVWARRYNKSGNWPDFATSLAIDGNGNVYVAGWSNGGNGADFVTIKYSPSGDTVWAKCYTGAENGHDEPSSLAVDFNGNIYVTGRSIGMTTRFDYATIKYNSNGDTVWVRRYDGPAHSYDEASCLAVDGNGNVYVTGKSASSLPPYINYDYLTIKYSPSGEILWTRRYSSSGNSDDIPTSLVLDGSGSVYVTGSSEDYTVTVKYNTTGDEQWVAKYRFGLTTSPVGIYLDATGNVIVAGTSSGSGWSTFTTIKYNQTPNAVREFSDAIPTTFALEQNYPNPFNPSTTIRYALPSSAHVRLTVYNLLGQVVSELVNEEQTAGWKEVLWNARQTTGGQASNFASGMYFCKLQAENFMEIKKMLLLR